MKRTTITTLAWHTPAAFIILGTLTLFAWFSTQGTWQLIAPDLYSGFFDAQAYSILHGRLDVPYMAIAKEAYVRDGKFYGYFGIGPSLLRIPLDLLWPQFAGQWSRIFCLGAALMSMLGALFILREALTRLEISLSPQFLGLAEALTALLSGAASTMFYLNCSASIYHEAVYLGNAFAVLFFCAFIRYTNTKSAASFMLCLAFSFLALTCRLNTGLGPCLALGFAVFCAAFGKFLSKSPLIGKLTIKEVPKVHVVGIVAFAVLVFSLNSFITYVKFGDPFEPMPLKYHELVAPSIRTGEFSGKLFRPGNINVHAHTYFAPDVLHVFTDTIPMAVMSEMRSDFRTHYTGHEVVVIETTIAVTITMAALLLLSFIGVCATLLGKIKAPFAVPFFFSAAGFIPVLFYYYAATRFTHDIYPFLLLLGILGLATLMRLSRHAIGKILLLLLTIIILANAANNYGATFFMQGHPAQSCCYGVSQERKAELMNMVIPR